jgi:Tfp pilus assembly protein PilO
MDKDKQAANRKILLDKTRDYTYIVMFLLVFSIFIFFAIRPSLTTAFSLKKEESDLKRIDAIYEKKIAEIITIQSLLEQNRDKIHLLDQAVSNYIEMNKVLKDIGEASSSVQIKKTSIGEVSLVKESDKALQKLKVQLEAVGSFDDILKYMNEIHSQRRLKTIQKVIISRDATSTDSGQIKVSMELEAYYL